MNRSTRFFLVLLRVVIGWHLLFAGLAKFADDYRGSEGYLQESTGPLSPYFHQMIGDRLADRMALQPLANNQTPEGTPLNQRFPKALDAEWENYYDRFAAHYGLDERQQQEAKGKLAQQKQQTAEWLDHGEMEIKITSPVGPPIPAVKTPQEWLHEYQEKREALQKYQATEFPFALRTPFAGDKNRDLMADKATAARIRGALSKELDKRTAAMKESLHEVLTPEQAQSKGRLHEPVRAGWTRMSRLDWIDFLVRWGLTVAGACLILGLFSRTACLVGALLLLSFYLAMPPLPGLPEAVRAEGYPFVNKNIVEMVALLTLATTASGRWAGLDALLHYLFGRRETRRQPGTGTGPVAPSRTVVVEEVPVGAGERGASAP